MRTVTDEAKDSTGIRWHPRAIPNRSAGPREPASATGAGETDRKPSNILVTYSHAADGAVSHEPVVMDFGLARDRDAGQGLTESGDVMGTPAYMSPEQARGEARRMDRRTDVYSLGATLYDVLTGQPPFEAETVVNILLKVMNEAQRPLRAHDPSLPEALELIVGKCLNKEAEQRYPSAQALADDLGRFLASQRVVARRLGYGYRLRYFARHNKALAVLALALCTSLLGLAGFGLRTYVVNRQREQRAKQQAELANRLGQEITKMEWLLRSARQLPLHDLEREKGIIRDRMQELQKELLGYGAQSRGLAYYALGRGHMALHEYPQALAALQQAASHGLDSGELHYALGVVYGKHFERALYEARLSGGGDWAQKQLRQIEPRYLVPALGSLERSRALRSDAPSYLEALIGFYRRDYETALAQAAAAVQKAPWLYEAIKLTADVHLARALQARDSGRYDEAEKEFAAAVARYKEAESIGRSDAEVYEGLAEAYVRQIEMATVRGRPTAAVYADAVEASEKITRAEPRSTAGSLKKGFAALMTMVDAGSGVISAERVERCLAETEAVLAKQPADPYASDVAAGCYVRAAQGAQAQGRDPEPLLRKARSILEPALAQSPRFLWGLNDMGSIYSALATHAQLHGDAGAKELLQRSIEYTDKALALDGMYLYAAANALFRRARLVALAASEEELRGVLLQADADFLRCTGISPSFPHCYGNAFIAYAVAAHRISRSGGDPAPIGERARARLAAARKAGSTSLDTEQYAALLHWVEASEQVERGQDAAAALAAMQAALERCFGISALDPMCRTLSAQADLTEGERLQRAHRPAALVLQRALLRAVQATQSPETYPDAWQVRAEAHLRLAQSAELPPAERARHLDAGAAALERVLAINPRHALALATRGALELERAQGHKDAAARRARALSALSSLRLAVASDPLLGRGYTPLLAQAEQAAAP